MFPNLKKSAIIAGLLLSFAIPSFAWDEVGHKLTAYIAWSQMRPDVRAKVIKTLFAAPEDAQLSTFWSSFGGGQSEGARQREFFMLIATWPDIIRDTKNFPVRNKNYAHSDWHYADTFWRLKDGKVEPVTDAKPSGLAMDKLVDFDKLIRSNATDAEKAVAIAWLEHLIGDIHQPLHASSRVTDSSPDGDQGGNLFLLTPKGTPRAQQENLHWLWDSIVIRYQPNTKDLPEADYLYPIGDEMMRLYPYDKVKNELADGKFDVWKDESYRLASTEAYKGVDWFQAPSDAYKKKAFEIAQRRIALAGYRMADEFSDAFSTPSPAGPAAPGQQ
jgi:hypothetical protein